MGLNAGYGDGDRHGIKFYPMLARIGLSLPRLINEPLARYDLYAQWIVEPFTAVITQGSMTTEEAGANLAFFSLRYDRGQWIVPFVEGGEGALYTGLRDNGLGTHFQFSSTIGGGVAWFVTPTVALSATYRLRHISNAGISAENSGLNANLFLLGLSYYPQR